MVFSDDDDDDDEAGSEVEAEEEAKALSLDASWSRSEAPTICLTAPWCKSMHGRNTLLLFVDVGILRRNENKVKKRESEKSSLLESIFFDMACARLLASWLEKKWLLSKTSKSSTFFSSCKNIPSLHSTRLQRPTKKRTMTIAVPLEPVIRDRASIKTLRLLALKLNRDTISGPEEIANATAKALRSVVSTAKFASLDELIQIIRTAGRYLQQSQPRGKR